MKEVKSHTSQKRRRRKHNRAPKDKCTSAQRFLLIIATFIFTFIAVTAFADDSPSFKKRYKYRKARSNQKMLKANLSTSFLNSASGHNSGYSANLGLGNSRNLFEAGAILNSETNQLSGGHLRYKRFFMPNFKSSSLYMQASAIYHNNSPLKNKLNVVMHEDDFTGDYETFNTVELYAGFGFQQRFLSSFFADFSIGLGGYKRSLASDEDNRHKSFIRYSDDQGIGVNVKLTVGYYLW